VRVRIRETLGASFTLPFRLWPHCLVYLAVSSLPGLPARYFLRRALDVLRPVDSALSGRNTPAAPSLPVLLGQLRSLWTTLAERLSVDSLIAVPCWVFWVLASGAITVVAYGYCQREVVGLGQSYGMAARRMSWLLLTGVFLQIIVLAGTLLCCLPGIGLAVLATFTTPVVMLSKVRNPFTVFAMSARLSRRLLGQATVLVLLEIAGGWVLYKAAGAVSLRILHVRVGEADASGVAKAMAQQLLTVLPTRLAGIPVACGCAFLYARLGGPRDR
jgi:hypothetical protein